MQFPQGYEIAITGEEIEINWQNLKLNQNFHFTSLKRKGFNCVGYALDLVNKDIDMFWFRDMYGLDGAKLDHSVNGYAKCFRDYFGYEICDDGQVENGFNKIALYSDTDNDFTHIAKQLENGNWTSKMGTYEDIEHYNLEALSGTLYGKPMLFMRKKLIL